ncbi:MAG: radical SAM protein [Myxococcales bacterium]|nr:radical SAM protein [Myxococcales bacterium]
MALPRMVFADERGRIFDHPTLAMCGSDGAGIPRPVSEDEIIPLPQGSDVFLLPGRAPIGCDPESGESVIYQTYRRKPVVAVAAFMAPAYTQILRPAYVTQNDAPPLPIYAYTSMGFRDGQFWVAGLRVDPDPRQDPYRFDRDDISNRVAARMVELGTNRVVGQLQRCALEYGCRAAQNYFLDRWEAPLPVSVACNAQCVGCISLQPDGLFKASHDRLKIAPKPDEVAVVALGHIARVPQAVVSFGQGCEGEPLLMGDLLVDSTRLIRSQTVEGTINLNTNGSRPDVVSRLCAAGLDSIRVSMNSPRPELYQPYYNPRGYTYRDVVQSLRVVRDAGGWKSINLFVFPGVTDTDAELDSLSDLISDVDLDMIQLRNLNIDPEVYASILPKGTVQAGMGMDRFMSALKSRFPHLRFGYFNPAKEVYHTWRVEDGR